MAQSKKEQVHIKLAIAKSALEVVIRHLSNDLGDKKFDDVRPHPDLYRKWLAREDYINQHAGIMKLFNNAKKRQGSRMILAQCMGTLRLQLNGEQQFCGYKIRASKSMYERGIPACPDPRCLSQGEPMEVEVEEWEAGDDAAISVTLAEEIADDVERRTRRDETLTNFKGWERGKKTEQPSADDAAWLSGKKKTKTV